MLLNAYFVNDCLAEHEQRVTGRSLLLVFRYHYVLALVW